MIESLPEQAPRPYGIVYLARNTVNGKGYVGQTVKALKARMDAHQQMAQRAPKLLFHRALRKYGFESFVWRVLTACDTIDDLNAAEQAGITTMKTKVPRGYNATDGGGGCSGFNHSAKAKDKMSKAKMGTTSWNKGVSPSAETRRKIGIAGMGRVVSPETRRKISKGLKGYVHSAEDNQKNSESKMGNTNNKGRVLSPETRDKISKTNTGRVHTAESKLKMSKSAKRRWEALR